MRIIRPHGMTKEAAKTWLESQIPGLIRQFSDSISGESHQWQGDVLHFRFAANPLARFNGTFALTDTDLDLDLPFPFLARGHEREAERKANQWLDENLPQSVRSSRG